MIALKMETLFSEIRPEVIFHAAAYKQVPFMELFPEEAVKNNIFGTRALVELADRLGVNCFVMISTDKAVRPSSVMGATKRVAEILVQCFARQVESVVYHCAFWQCPRFGWFGSADIQDGRSRMVDR